MGPIRTLGASIGLAVTAAMSVSAGETGLDAPPYSLVAPYTDDFARASPANRFPMTAVFNDDRRTLVFIAASHTVDPQSDTFRQIASAFESVQPDIVIVEGFPAAWGPSPERLVGFIQENGKPGGAPQAQAEPYFAALLAYRAGKPFLGGEPQDDEINPLLLATYEADDIFFTYLLRIIPQWLRDGTATTLDDTQMRPSFEQFQRLYASRGLDASGLTLEGFQSWYRDMYGHDYRDDPEIAQRAVPGLPTLPGEILAQTNVARDRVLLQTILDQFDTYSSVMVVYGGSHLATLWPALEYEFGPPEILASAP